MLSRKDLLEESFVFFIIKTRVYRLTFMSKTILPSNLVTTLKSLIFKMRLEFCLFLPFHKGVVGYKYIGLVFD